MSVGLDTSVALRLLVGSPESQSALAWALVKSEYSAGRKVLISDIVVAEVFHALKHHYAVPAEDAVAVLRQVLQDPRVAGEAAKSLLADESWSVPASEFVDALIHQGYSEVHRQYVTFDKKASRFSGSRLLR